MTDRIKPPNLIYDVDESPGIGALIMLGIQHIFSISVGFVFPVVVVDAIGGSSRDASFMISIAMLVTGVATILQALARGPVGSGYLCPLLNGPAFVPTSIMAGRVGGLPMIFGMTFIGSMFEGLFSRVAARMRAIFPAEVTGTIVMMVGISVIPSAMKRFCGIDAAHPVLDPSSVFVAVTTLAAMIGFTIWGKGKTRLFSVLIGMAVGYALSVLMGILGSDSIRQFGDALWFSVPAIGSYGMSFNAALVIPFVITSLSSSLKTMGDLTTCQKINDTEWKRPEMRSIGRGILACALGNMLAGLAGTLGVSPSSSNVGLSIATGATSRTIAYSTGVLLVLIACMPKIAELFVIMPSPVMGAILVFAVSFMIIAGIQIMLSRLLDSRKTFVIGTSIIFGLSVDLIPGMYGGLPDFIMPFFQSSLSLATISAVILNLFFRIGISKTARIELVPGVDTSNAIFTFMRKQGGVWGAMPDVITRAAIAVNETFEAAVTSEATRGPVRVAVTFDEFNLDIEMTYEGTAMILPVARPTAEEIIATPGGGAQLSLFLLRRYADKVESSARNSQCSIRLHFNH